MNCDKSYCAGGEAGITFTSVIFLDEVRAPWGIFWVRARARQMLHVMVIMALKALSEG